MSDTAGPNSHPTTRGHIQLNCIQKQLPFRALSEDDWAHWTTKGYVVVPRAVPPANIDRLVQTLWEFDEKDPLNPDTWHAPQRREHKMKELNNTGMLEIYNHQHLWDNRMEQRVYDAFVDIWDCEELWVTIDRANLNLPGKDAANSDGFIHWDVDTSLKPLPIGVQGILSLMPQDETTGGFQCVPELFEHFDEWVKTQPADRDPMHPDLTDLQTVSVELEPGDLLIFNSLLAHGIRPNRSKDRPRMAQYISMHPAEPWDMSEKQERIRLWRDLDHPRRDAFPGDPREWERHNGKTATLTPLGERLLGLQDW